MSKIQLTQKTDREDLILSFPLTIEDLLKKGHNYFYYAQFISHFNGLNPPQSIVEAWKHANEIMQWYFMKSKTLNFFIFSPAQNNCLSSFAWKKKGFEVSYMDFIRFDLGLIDGLHKTQSFAILLPYNFKESRGCSLEYNHAVQNQIPIYFYVWHERDLHFSDDLLNI